MRLFCSFAFTGENIEELESRMKAVVGTLNESGHDAYCPLFDQHKIAMQKAGDIAGIFAYAFENIKKCEGMVAIVTSNRKSEGQLMEIGVSLAEGKPLYLFIHEAVRDLPSHLPKLATQTYSWNSAPDLLTALQKV